MPAETVYFTAPRTIEIKEESVSDPAAHEVLVDATVSMISPGTELLIYRGEAPRSLESDIALESLAGNLEFPLAYGYSVVGRVVETGVNVDSSWLDTDVVCLHPHSSTFTVPVAEIHEIPPGIDPATGVFLPHVETAVNFVLDGRPLLGERIVVFGQGLIGLLTTAVLASFPVDSITAVEPVARRRVLGEQLGADRSLSPDAIDDLTPGDHGSPNSGGADLTYELSGDPEALDAAVAVTGYDGRVIVGSWYGTKPTALNLGGRFHRSRISLESSQVSTIDPRLRGRWTTGRRIRAAWESLREIETTALVTHRMPVGEAERAYRLLDTAPDEGVGVLLTY